MAITSPIDLEDARRELQNTYREMGTAASAAASADEHAEQMREVARDLETAVDPIRRSLAAIFTLHTTATWVGRAAAASRHRLDRLGDQLDTAIRSIDQLITALQTAADLRELEADRLWRTHGEHAGRAQTLEDVLGVAIGWGIR